MRLLAPGFSLFAGLMMLGFGVMVMRAVGCWPGCDAGEIAGLSWTLLPGAVVTVSSLTAWRWINREVKPALWAPLLFVLLGLASLVGAGFMLSLGLSDPMEYLVVLALAIFAAAQLRIAMQLRRPGTT